VSICGGVTIFTKCFTLDAGATITGVGYGFSQFDFAQPGKGLATQIMCTSSGSGTMFINFGTGGGHGGSGGGVCPATAAGCTLFYCAPGGTNNDDPVHPSLCGSSGGYAGNYDFYPCMRGGALLWVVVYDPISDVLGPATIDGTIDMSGGYSCGGSFYHNGAGAGGTILLEASEIDGTGLLRADGGQATSNGGGGGGGGIISLIENDTSFLGTISVAGGAGGSGFDGSPGIVTFTAAPASGY
jgi:hypothetical protein